MDCPHCQQTNRDGAKFCSGCGQAFEISCARCGVALQAGARFCDQCGAPAEETPAQGGTPGSPRASRDPRSYTPKHLADRILDSRAALEGERKRVTVLFADVAGFTALSERCDPEEVHSLMDRAFQSILEEVHRYEGTINQFLGDGVMALFGAPAAVEDAPRRAVQAALAVQRALAPLDEEVRERHGRDFRMRIGVHTGLVVVAKIGDDLRMDYTAVGDTTNLAARLQSMAEPGSVLLSEATQSEIAGYFELVDRGPHEFKGKSRPVRVFEAASELSHRGRIDVGAEDGLTPLVGRERELETLTGAFANAVDGRGQVAFLVGEAGLGKSRTLLEFRRRLGEQPHRWIEGRCASFARSSPFYVVADALRRTMGIEDKDDDEAALEKLRAQTRSFGDDFDWTAPYIAHLLSLPVEDPAVASMDAISRRSETFRALEARFRRASEQRPAVVVIEDLHWIDAASEEFFAYLNSSVPTSRVLMIFTYRPGYEQPFGDRSYHVRIALQPLSGVEVTAMAGTMLQTDAVPEALRALIEKKADGNPFFLEELVKSLTEQGAVRVEQGRLRVLDQSVAVSIPDRVQDLLMARIDRLDDAPKRAIQIASVIGREFAVRLLERISEVGARMQPIVDELRALELIYEKAAEPELSFMFKHALTHDVAYESILIQRRKVLHNLVATTIEDLYADRLSEHYEALAHHFERAEQWERALEYREKAGDKAIDAYAAKAAIEHFRGALAIADRLGDAVPPERRRLLEEALGEVLRLVNAYRESADAFERAAALAGSDGAASMNLARGAYGSFWAHDYENCRRLTASALTRARRGKAPDGEAMALALRAFDSVVCGDLRAYDESIAEAEQVGAEGGEVRAFLNYLAMQRSEWRGEYHAAIREGERSLAIVRSMRLSSLLPGTIWFVAKAYCCLGRYGAALDRLREGLDVAERLGDRAFQARVLNTLGWCSAEYGAYARATVYNERSTQLAVELLDEGLVVDAAELHGNGAINLAGNRIALGDLDGAEAAMEPVRAALERDGDPWMRWRYSLHLTDVMARKHLASGDFERAYELARAEHEGATGVGGRKIAARALELGGRALLSMGRNDEAAETLGDALQLARELEYPPVAWRAQSLLAEVAYRAGHREAAERSAQTARGLVDSLAASLGEDDRRQFRALGERLVADPLGAYR